MRRIVPVDSVVVYTDAVLVETALSAREQSAIATARPARRAEFLTGRACAHAALRQLAATPVDVPKGFHGEPLWPEGVVGSITHCAGLRACAAAPGSRIAAIGIDAELTRPLPVGVARLITQERERDLLQANAGSRLWGCLALAAKEAIFKAWHTVTHRWLEFHDVWLSVIPATRAFHGRLLVPGPSVGGRPLRYFHGRWLEAGGVVFTTTHLRAASGGVFRPPRRLPQAIRLGPLPQSDKLRSLGDLGDHTEGARGQRGGTWSNTRVDEDPPRSGLR